MDVLDLRVAKVPDPWPMTRREQLGEARVGRWDDLLGADEADRIHAYVRTHLERDLQALASITALPDFRGVMRAAALRLGQVLNHSDLPRDVAVAQPTMHRWLKLVGGVVSPRAASGVALHLAGLDTPLGTHLEGGAVGDVGEEFEPRSLRRTTGRRADA